MAETFHFLLAKHPTTGVDLPQCSAFNTIDSKSQDGKYIVLSCGTLETDFLAKHSELADYVPDVWDDYIANNCADPLHATLAEARAVMRTQGTSGSNWYPILDLEA